MFTARMMVAVDNDDVLTLQSDSRALMRSLSLLCEENEIPCAVTVEQAPRLIKFKAPQPSAIADAKADAKADAS